MEIRLDGFDEKGNLGDVWWTVEFRALFFWNPVKCKYTQNAGSFKAADILCYDVQQVAC